ncbi:hypothetical protein Tco_0123368 [Tanacetum coccineum]
MSLCSQESLFITVSTVVCSGTAGESLLQEHAGVVTIVRVLNPFGYAKLTTFIILCKAYGGEPTVDLFRGFLNLCPAEDWLTFAKREYFELLSKANKLDKKTFKDKIPPSIFETLMYQCLARHPANVQTFPGPILYLAILKSSWKHNPLQPMIYVDGNAKMAFQNFMFTADDEEMSFLPKEPSNEFGAGSPSSSINKEDLFIATVVPGGSVAERMMNRRCRMRGSAKSHVKHKLETSGSPPRIIRQKSANAKVESSSFLAISDDDDEDVVDNVVNQRAQELLKVIEQMKGECEVIKEREKAREEECEELKAKCKAVMADFDNNLTIIVLRQKIAFFPSKAKDQKSSLDRMLLESQKWAGYEKNLITLESKVAMAEVVLKVVPYITIELVHNDEMDRLLQSYKKQYTQARNDLVTVVFPFFSEATADPLAPTETLLSKKP